MPEALRTKQDQARAVQHWVRACLAATSHQSVREHAPAGNMRAPRLTRLPPSTPTVLAALLRPLLDATAIGTPPSPRMRAAKEAARLALKGFPSSILGETAGEKNSCGSCCANMKSFQELERAGRARHRKPLTSSRACARDAPGWFPRHADGFRPRVPVGRVADSLSS